MIENDKSPAQRSDPYKPRNLRWLRIKSFVREKIRKYPVINAIAVKVWRTGKFFVLQNKWKVEAVIGGASGTYIGNMDVNKIYWISPKKIVFSSLQYFDHHIFKGHILGGDWDRLEKRFDSIDLYVAIRQVCVEGKKWADTIYYQRVMESLKNGKFSLGYRDEVSFLEHCREVESLFRNIQQNGYKSQKELFLAGQIQDPLVAEEEITINIGRFGDILFTDGAHRLSIAKILDIPVIPVKIAVRHKDWFKFKKELLLYGQQDGSRVGKLYQPATHPDLLNVPAQHECENRFQLIKKNTSVQSGSLLDIGANLGYFCHRFEEAGLDCYAVENKPSTVYFLRRLARAENRKFKIITESFLDSVAVRNTSFNIVLALNIFHHSLKTEETFEKLLCFLKNLQTNEIFFEAHCMDESQMKDAYKNLSPDEFVKLITANSRLKNAVLLGVMKDGRPLYKIY